MTAADKKSPKEEHPAGQSKADLKTRFNQVGT